MDELYYKAIAAENAWSKLLHEQFGKRAGDMRYTERGHGKPGTPLHAAYEAWRDSTNTWLDYLQTQRRR